jgi:hypothetical protein
MAFGPPVALQELMISISDYAFDQETNKQFNEVNKTPNVNV